MYVSMYMYACVFMYVCMYMCIYMCVHVCVYVSICMFMCLYMCVYVFVSEYLTHVYESPWSQAEDVDPGAGVTSGCEPPCVSAGNQTSILWRSSESS